MCPLSLHKSKATCVVLVFLISAYEVPLKCHGCRWTSAITPQTRVGIDRPSEGFGQASSERVALVPKHSGLTFQRRAKSVPFGTNNLPGRTYGECGSVTVLVVGTCSTCLRRHTSSFDNYCVALDPVTRRRNVYLGPFHCHRALFYKMTFLPGS